MTTERVQLIPGDRYGSLVYTGRCKVKSGCKSSTKVYEFRCDCGTVKHLLKGNVVSGHTKSCGCLAVKAKLTHGLTNSPTYKSWDNMLQRVKNTKLKCAKNYSLKGIDVDPRWLKFENFLQDMGERPAAHSLERRDGNKGYWPENCEWATRDVQNNNTSRNRILTVFGKSMTLTTACREYNISVGTVIKRLASGKTPEEALTVPVDLRYSR